MIEYKVNTASEDIISEHLRKCDAGFNPPLSHRVHIKGYAHKIKLNAVLFEAWSNNTLVGLVAIYCNDKEQRTAFVTSVSVLKDWTGNGIAMELMAIFLEKMKDLAIKKISLEVGVNNYSAIKLYEKNGFILGEQQGLFVMMNLDLDSGDKNDE